LLGFVPSDFLLFSNQFYSVKNVVNLRVVDASVLQLKYVTVSDSTGTKKLKTWNALLLKN